MDFVYLHELAHVVLGHAGVHPKRDELEADNLAINCLLQKNRELSDGDDLLTPFAAAGAVLLFHFFEVIDALNKPNISSAHPSAIFRRAALSLAIFGAMTDGPPLKNYQGLNQLSHMLFSAAVARTGSETGEHRDKDLGNFRVVVVPSGRAPYVQLIRRGHGTAR